MLRQSVGRHSIIWSPADQRLYPLRRFDLVLTTEKWKMKMVITKLLRINCEYGNLIGL